MYLGLPISNFGSPKGSRKIFLGSSLDKARNKIGKIFNSVEAMYFYEPNIFRSPIVNVSRPEQHIFTDNAIFSKYISILYFCFVPGINMVILQLRLKKSGTGFQGFVNFYLGNLFLIESF